MIRGTGILVRGKNSLKVDISTEFNGAMDPYQNGDLFWYNLQKVKNKTQFLQFLKKFNEEYFKYKEKLLYTFNANEIFDEINNEEIVLDFRKDYYDRFFSDWIFIKNESRKPIRIITDNSKTQELIIEPHKSLRFKFGKIIGPLTFKFTKEFYEKIKNLEENIKETEETNKKLKEKYNEINFYI